MFIGECICSRMHHPKVFMGSVKLLKEERCLKNIVFKNPPCVMCEKVHRELLRDLCMTWITNTQWPFWKMPFLKVDTDFFFSMSKVNKVFIYLFIFLSVLHLFRGRTIPFPSIVSGGTLLVHYMCGCVCMHIYACIHCTFTACVCA